MSELVQKGLIVTGHGRHYVVESDDGQRRICHPRGKKSQAVVGDHVDWLPAKAGQGEEGSIETILPRRNLFYRQDEIRTKAFAANIDQVLVLLAAEPVFSELLLAKALVAAEASGIDVMIGLNKQDLGDAYAKAWERLAAYRQMWPAVYQEQTQALLKPASSLYPVLRLQLDAADGGTDYAALLQRLQGRSTLVLGPSGVGKSTLINRLVPNAAAQTAEISRALNSGKHTTTTTSWYWVERTQQTAVIDSPGFQEFGLNHIYRQDLQRWMPDIARHATGCKFYNCMHIHEPGCVVTQAVGSDGAVADVSSSDADSHCSNSHHDGSSAGVESQSVAMPNIAPTRYALYQTLMAQLSDN